MTNTFSLENDDISIPYKQTIVFGDQSTFTKIRLKSGSLPYNKPCWVEIKLLEISTNNFLNITDVPFYDDIEIFPNNDNILNFTVN